MPRPISGNLLAPKIMMMMNRMTTSSGKPRRPIIRTPSRAVAEQGDCITLATAAGRTAAVETRRSAVTPISLAALTALVLLTAGASARGIGQFTSGVNLVEVYASVTNAAGEPVSALTRDDF